jgi:hypothetical protein
MDKCVSNVVAIREAIGPNALLHDDLRRSGNGPSIAEMQFGVKFSANFKLRLYVARPEQSPHLVDAPL